MLIYPFVLQAAEKAGLSPVRLIKEPEAAALWTTKKLDVAINSGDVFVVCDAGGGTVDLVSYEVQTTSPKLQVKEVVPGTGQTIINSSIPHGA
jgi:molecular chaperone DnaK (HSP70)